MSGFSLQCVMALAFLGAKGRTASQIQNGLSFPEKKSLTRDIHHVLSLLNTEGKEGVVSRSANRIYVSKGFILNKSFKTDIKAINDGMVEEIGFSNGGRAANTINSWVEMNTDKKIKDLFRPDDFDWDTKLVLVNALYFKGEWLTRFATKLTRNGTFYANSGITQVPMMRRKGQYSVSVPMGLNAAALTLPYVGKRFYMIIVLPNEKNGLHAVEEQLPLSRAWPACDQRNHAIVGGG